MASVFKPVKKENVTIKIQNSILELIHKGVIQPGDKLPSERELCLELEVSRASLRESIEGLSSVGVLTKKNDGVYISENIGDVIRKPLNFLAQIHGFSIDELYETRICIETQIIRLVTARATPEDIRCLEEIVKMTDKASDTREKRIVSGEFHRALAEITHNRVLIAVFSGLYDLIQETKRDDTLESVSYHHVLLEQIKKRDPDAAAEAMKKHIEMVKEFSA